MLEEYFIFAGLKIYTQSVVVLLSAVISTFMIWREAKKQGFDEEQVFDMVVVVIIISVYFGRVVYAVDNYKKASEMVEHVLKFWLYGTDLKGVVAGAIVTAYLYTKGKKWSVYRIMDIFAMGASLGTPLVMLSHALIKQRYEFMIAAGLMIFVHSILLILRERDFVFGGLFGIALILDSLVFAAVYYSANNLIFLGFLFTLGEIVLISRLRSRKKKMRVSPGITKDFLRNIRDILLKKDKELAEEEDILKKEDAYNTPDRDILNNEFEDEAMEDVSHERTDIVRRSISDMRIQVRKALAKINIGTYGICEICHKPIDEARLKAFPQATTCVGCAERRGEKS
ncbi:prolipoprotein diacylglyceryl transferase [candidate division WWE3 bacterium]|nr:prolipoprotein diacylglyceryl transferase [candidate division WWE3 bacterium]